MQLKQYFYGMQIMWLVKGGQIAQFIERREGAIINQQRLSISSTAMHHPVPHGTDITAMVQYFFQRVGIIIFAEFECPPFHYRQADGVKDGVF